MSHQALDDIGPTAPAGRAGYIGWFHLMAGHELGRGSIVPLTLFGEQVALYRGASGRPMLIDPFCPHMGAHLAYGGTVIGDDVMCPFHGWRWGPDGSNTAIPYCSEPNRRRRVTHYVVAEVAGHLWAWLQPVSDRPLADHPLAHAETHDVAGAWTVPANILSVAELLVDGAHLARALQVSSAESSLDAGLAGRLAITHRLGDGEVIAIDLWGLGIAVITSDRRPGPIVQTQVETDGVTAVKLLAPTAIEMTGWWARVLAPGLDVLEHLEFTADLDDLPSEHSTRSFRQWAVDHRL